MTTHLFVIHFPIAAAMIGAFAEVVGVASGNAALRVRGGQLLMIAGFAALLAVLTGDGAKLAAISSGQLDPNRLALHEQWGSVGAWVLVGAATARAVWRHRLEGPMSWVNVGIALVAVAIALGVTITGTGVRHG